MLPTRLGSQSSLTNNAITTLSWMGLLWFTIERKLGGLHAWNNPWMNNFTYLWLGPKNRAWNLDQFIVKAAAFSLFSSMVVLEELWERKNLISYFLFVIDVLVWKTGYVWPKTVFNLHPKNPNYPFINWTLLDNSNITSIFGIVFWKQVRNTEILPHDFQK